MLEYFKMPEGKRYSIDSKVFGGTVFLYDHDFVGQLQGFDSFLSAFSKTREEARKFLLGIARKARKYTLKQHEEFLREMEGDEETFFMRGLYNQKSACREALSGIARIKDETAKTFMEDYIGAMMESDFINLLEIEACSILALKLLK